MVQRSRRRNDACVALASPAPARVARFSRIEARLQQSLRPARAHRLRVVERRQIEMQRRDHRQREIAPVERVGDGVRAPASAAPPFAPARRRPCSARNRARPPAAARSRTACGAAAAPVRSSGRARRSSHHVRATDRADALAPAKVRCGS